MTSESEKTDLAELFLQAARESAHLIHGDNPEWHTHLQIAHIMRRAAGLPYSDTPAAEWQEDGMPKLFLALFSIVSSASGPHWDDPKSDSKKLHKLRHSLRDLKRQILALGKNSVNNIDHYIWQHKVTENGLKPKIIKRMQEKNAKRVCNVFLLGAKATPANYWMPIEDLIGEMDLLEEATSSTIRLTEALTREREDMGQTRTYAAKQVALEVAKYMYEVTDKIPAYYIEENPRGYTKAVLEIYDLLGIPSGSFQKAGAWAIAKLKSGLSFEVLQK